MILRFFLCFAIISNFLQWKMNCFFNKRKKNFKLNNINFISDLKIILLCLAYSLCKKKAFYFLFYYFFLNLGSSIIKCYEMSRSQHSVSSYQELTLVKIPWNQQRDMGVFSGRLSQSPSPVWFSKHEEDKAELIGFTIYVHSTHLVHSLSRWYCKQLV